LFEFYSPELVNAQHEYLQTLKIDQSEFQPASKERLLALGIPSSYVKQLDGSRKARQRVPIYAPQDGIVARLDIREGMYIKPESELLTLVDLSSVWLLVDVFERQANWVAVGQKAQVRLPYLPGKIWSGEVEYIYPELDPKTRTLKVRLRFDNPSEQLKINMFANVTLYSNPRENVVSISTEALIRSGDRHRVVVARGDGRFEPVEVQAGIESGDRTEIVAGLESDDTVVVSGQFLIDSEASLAAGLRRMTEPATSEVWGAGVVGKVDAEKRNVRLSHGPIAALGWPDMTMDFRLADSIDAGQLKPGAKVRFALEKSPAGYIIVAVKPVGDGVESPR
jgi:Cu(I)/Ag(I) efflux system membrane fusion protein